MIFHNSLQLKCLTTIIQNQLLIRVHAVQYLPRLCFAAVLIPNHSNEINSSIDNTNNRLRAVSYFSLQSYCTRNLSTRAAKPRAARNEGVSLVWSQSLIVIITSWFAIALDEIRTRRILREKADCKQSTRIMVFAT